MATRSGWAPESVGAARDDKSAPGSAAGSLLHLFTLGDQIFEALPARISDRESLEVHCLVIIGPEFAKGGKAGRGAGSRTRATPMRSTCVMISRTLSDRGL